MSSITKKEQGDNYWGGQVGVSATVFLHLLTSVLFSVVHYDYLQ